MVTTADRQLCTFHLDRFLFGIEVQRVQEVLRPQTLTRVPLARDVVEGLINLRGQIVTALDMRRRLDLAERDGEVAAMNVVVQTDDGPLSLLVDRIGDVVDVDEDAFEEPPDNLSGTARELIRGAYKLDDVLLLVLDVDQAVHVAGNGS